MWPVLLMFLLFGQSLSYESGWVPLSLDEVLLRSAPKYNPSTAYITTKLWSPRIDATDEEITKIPVMKVTKPHKMYQLSSEENNLYNFVKSVGRSFDRVSSPGKSENSGPYDQKYNTQIEKNPESSNNFQIYSDKKTRRAKQVNDFITERAQDIMKLNTSTANTKITEVNKENSNYEVTETPDASDQIKSEQTVIEQMPGYIYNIPNNKFDESNNLTTKFLSILTKYNINLKTDDTNYAISRSNPSKFSRDKLLLVTLPIKVPQGHNSQSHESLDPILAMLLSNYGVYLPGMFGSANKYKNLYGYLASNNIHNNRPFGLYKIFSDTDSSN